MTELRGYRRYAVYYAPARGSALGRFGAAWLGWDAEAGTAVARPAVPGLPRPVQVLADAPRRYGFHGTLKAPFRLADGRSAEALGAAVAVLAASEPAFALPLCLASLGRFLALVPAEPRPRLDALAARAVAELDGFRAPLEPEECARRAEGLDARERALLERWGYPFVMERFQFHLTLTGPLDSPDRCATVAALAPVLAPILSQRQSFGDLCLFGEPEAGPFRLLRRYPLKTGGSVHA